MTIIDPPIQKTSTVEAELVDALDRIAIEAPELAEARRRRGMIEAALLPEFPGAVIYLSGSVAHGDALTPLGDIDVGIIVPNPNGEYGPYKKGPTELKERAAKALQVLRSEFPNLRIIVEGQKRSILVRFGSPVAKGHDDFTADVIVAIDNTTGDGLYIPRHDHWDRSHPQKHTQMIADANGATGSAFKHGTRLMKHWARGNENPIFSWHIKALALAAITRPMSMTEYLQRFIDHAIDELKLRDTPDPAGVSSPIKVNEKGGFTRTQVVAELEKAKAHLVKALEYDQEGHPVLAKNALADLFNDEAIMPRPDAAAVREAGAAYWRGRSPALVTTAPATLPSTSAYGQDTPRRAWAC